jgi:hypothetical protein
MNQAPVLERQWLHHPLLWITEKQAQNRSNIQIDFENESPA